MARPTAQRPALPELDEEMTPAEIEHASVSGSDYMDGIDANDSETINEGAGRGETYYQAKDANGDLLANAQFLTDMATNGFVTVYRAPHGQSVVLPREHIGDYLKKPIDNVRWPELAKMNRRAFYSRPQSWFTPEPERHFKCDFCQKMLVSATSKNEHMRGAHRSEFRLKQQGEEMEAREEQRRNSATLTKVLEILATSNQETRQRVDGLLSELGVKG